MNELAAAWGWNLHADRKNIYVAETPHMYVSLMRTQIVFFVRQRLADVSQAVSNCHIVETINAMLPNEGYRVVCPTVKGRMRGVCLKIEIPYGNDWSDHRDEVRKIAERLVEVLNENRILGRTVVTVDGRTGEDRNLPTDPFEGIQLDFCPEIGDLSTTTMSDLIATSVFNLPSGEGESFRELLRRRYEQMRTNFLNVDYDARGANGNLKWDLDGCHTRLERCPDARLEVPLAKYDLNNDETNRRMGLAGNFGHDMPVWLCKEGDHIQQYKRVILVSQDPWRNGDPIGAVYLSTPFSLHCKGYRADEKVLKYTKLIANLLEQGIVVYATDFKKWYAGGRGFVGDKNFHGIKLRAKEILKTEIDSFRPDLIVAVGGGAYDFMKNEKLITLNDGMSKDKLGDVEGRTIGTYEYENGQSHFMAIIHSSGNASRALAKAGIKDYSKYYFDKIIAAPNLNEA